MYDGYAVAPSRRLVPDLDTGERVAGLLTIIERVEQAIEEETASIRSDLQFDVAGSNIRKSRHLYDLTRALKAHGIADLPATAKDSLARLREKLAENQTVITAHLSAVTEVAAMMQTAIQRAEADGTYSESTFGRSF
ncbi:hypothetical protein [Tianweitania sediminis]|uniref:hypothetical protein n=1 Tax=Tianweitania sediminis TaxID=1502156 RepID=UPI001FD779D3|nr:hypothetical protein [Tianweitania sediminis]